MISVQGNTLAMNKARDLFPDYMDRIGHDRPDDPLNMELVNSLIDLGLVVTVNKVSYSAEGQYCEIPYWYFEDDEDFDEDDDE